MKSEALTASRIAGRINHFSVVTSRPLRVLFLLCLLAGMVNAQQPAPPSQANIILEVGHNDLYEWAHAEERIAAINIEIRNINRPSENVKRIRLIALNSISRAEVQGQKRIDMVEHDVSYPLEQNSFFDLNALQRKSLFLKVAETSWTDGSATITFITSENQTYVSIKLPVEPGTYQVVATVTNGGWTTTVADSTQGYAENRAQKVSLKAPTFFGGMWEKLISSEGLLGAIIAALIAVLIGVLKDKIKAVFNSLLDLLGKYVGGRLAERRFLKRYIDNLSFNHKYLKPVGFNTSGISRPLLEEVFVSLRIASSGPAVVASKKDENTPAISFNAAFKQNQYMVILGGPGAGKTTTLSYALLAFAQKKAEEKFGIEEELLPIYIPLRRLSNSTRSIAEDLTDKDTQILSAEILKECPSNYFERKLKKGQCLVLLDGLDEVIDEKTHRQAAERINSLVAAYPDNRFVVTCRNAGWKDLLSGEFKILLAQDFNRDEIQRFVLGWHKAVITQSEYGRLQLDIPDKKKFEEIWETRKEQFVKPAIDIQSRRLIHAIDSNNRILAIAVNPMLLSLISLVHFNRQYLPRGRTVLYSQCIELLIDSWDRTRDILFTGTKVTAIQKEAVLREIAFDFQVNGKVDEKRDNLEQLIKQIAEKLGISMRAEELLKDIEVRSGLLVEKSIDVFSFTHLTLQEYLVAKHIQLNQSNYWLLAENFDRQEWREVILLYTGLIDDATELIKGAASDSSLERQILAGYCIGDAQHCDSTVSSEVVERLLWELNNNHERTDELINVLSAITEDFSNQPLSVEEKLSAKFINTTIHDRAPQRYRLLAVAILGQARITRALPALIKLIHNPDEALARESSKAIIQLGNLALPALQEQPLLKSPDSPTELDFLLYSNLQTGEFQAYAEPLVEVLAGINTGQSARLLIKLYEWQNPYLDQLISLKLSQMMTNKFVEADLRDLEIAHLPLILRNSSIDRNGWSYKSAKSGFWLLDTKLRSDMLDIIHQDGAEDTEAPAEEKFRGVSFKILFPAFLSYLRSLPRGYIKPERYREDGFRLNTFNLLGFDETEPGKLYYLARQINQSFTIPLDLALQNINSSDASTYSYKTTPGVNLLVLLANIYFGLFYALVLYLATLGMFGIIVSADVPYRMSQRYLIEATWLVIPILFYAAIILVTKYKLKERYLSKKFLSLVIAPITNFLKVLPYLTKQRPWIKLISFQLLVLCFSVVGFAIFEVIFWGDYFFSSWALIITAYGPGLVFLVLSSLYWKYYVLSQNPVSQLLLLHPEGRRIVREGNI